MEWQDNGIVLGVHKHGETSVILEVMTKNHGRHLGLVRGGRSRTMQPTLQPGNQLALVWRARLEDHLGMFTVEPVKLHAAQLMQSALGVSAIQLLAAHVRLLPEREADIGLYGALSDMLSHLGDPATTAEFLVRFELAVLDRLGFGLDLDICALSGAREGLAYVSPKTGRAVTQNAGAKWADKLLPLPAFLSRGANVSPDQNMLSQAFDLTGYFLARNVYEPRGVALPAIRDSFLNAMARANL